MSTCRAARFLAAALALAVARAALGDSTSDGGPSGRTDDFSYLVSWVSSTNEWATGTGWDLSFRKTWFPYLATSLDYLNDAHFPGHHRDGVTGEVWLPLSFFDKYVTTLSAGVGPFYYFDTAQASNVNGYADNHGWAWMYSLDTRVLVWPREEGTGVFVEARYDHTSPSHSIETNSWSVGFGYRAYSDFDNGHGFVSSNGSPDFEIAAYAYKTVVNSFTSQSSPAEELELRWHMWNVFKLSGGFINEGNAQLIRRNGFESEIWAEPSFFSDAVSVGAGVGFYSAIDKYHPAPSRLLSGIVSGDISWRFLKCWGIDSVDARFIWHRIVTDYNRDTDIVLFGIGYRF